MEASRFSSSMVHCVVWHWWGNTAAPPSSSAQENPIIIHGNARSLNAVTFTTFLLLWQWEILEHPPYSPDISSCDQDLFAKAKGPLRGTRYNIRDELLRIDRSIPRISTSFLLYRVPRSNSLTLAKRSLSHGVTRKRRHLVVQNPIILHDNARTSCAARNGRFWNIHRTHPIWVHAITSLRQSERTTTRDPVQYRRWTYPSYKVNKEYQQKMDALMVYDAFQTFIYIYIYIYI